MPRALRRRRVTCDDLIMAMKNRRRFDGEIFRSDARSDGLDDFMPSVLQSSFELAEGAADALSGVKLDDFEAWADTAWAAIDDPSVAANYAVLDVDELVAAIAQAVLEASPIPSTITPDVRLNLRGGLQISRVRIKAGRSSALRLSNAHLPFALRFIGCIFEVPVSLNSCDLVTLDLSGSALAGLDATFLKASGSVRLRRTYVKAPVDFGGARVHGFFDGTDMVIKPFGECPANQGFDGDRGMLNLSQATIDNDIRLERATIWGGLAMRGLKTQRTLFLNEAVILSPVGVLEAMVAQMLQRTRSAALASPRRAIRRLETIPTLKRPRRYQKGRRRVAWRARQLGTAAFNAAGPFIWRRSCLHLLLVESLRVRTSSVRCDGMQIGGSIFAQSMDSHGRMRLKYAIVAGGLALQGSRLRAIEASRRMFDDIEGAMWPGPRATRPQTAPDPTWAKSWELAAYRRETYGQTVSIGEFNHDRMAFDADGHALDISEARFGGSVRIGNAAGEDLPKTAIDGIVAGLRANIDGDLVLTGAKFQWSVRVSDTHPGAESAGTAAQTTYVAAGYSTRSDDCRKAHLQRVEQNHTHAIKLDNATINGDVQFEDTLGINGIRGHAITVIGDFSLFAKGVIVTENDRPVLRLDNPAKRIEGNLDLTGADIRGDCRLLFGDGDRIGCDLTRFDPWLSVKAEYAGVGGELEIASAHDDCSSDMSVQAWDDIVDAAEAGWQRHQRAAHGGKPGWDALIGEVKRKPKIDLRNAKATVFVHPPAAWPASGRLELVGFRYTRSGASGPLAPHPSTVWTVEPGPWPQWVVAWLCAIAGILLWFRVELGAMLDVASDRAAIESELGSQGIDSLMMLLFVAAAISFLPYLRSPRARQSLPMADSYMKLQRFEVNRYRTKTSLLTLPLAAANRIGKAFSLKPRWEPRGNVYHPLEPYLVAAAALREEGKWVSANLLERRLSEVRAGQLSWRQHFFIKSGFKLLHWLTGFGFNYFWLGTVMFLLVILAEMVGHNAVRTGALVAVAEDSVLVARHDQATGWIDGEIETSSIRLCDTGNKIIDDCANFSSLAYAIDLVVPAVSTGERDAWKFADRWPRPIIGGERILPYWLPEPTHKNALTLLRILGLALSGLLLTGLASRLAITLGRYRE